MAFGGETYRGRWVYAGRGSLAAVFVPGATTMPLFVGSGGPGEGNALLTTESGKSLRCQFQYSSWTASGMGVCQDAGGRLYDIQIES